MCYTYTRKSHINVFIQYIPNTGIVIAKSYMHITKTQIILYNTNKIKSTDKKPYGSLDKNKCTYVGVNYFRRASNL